MRTIEGNLLDVRAKTGHTYLLHQVNCRGVMGAGVAKAIRERWPVVFARYKKECSFFVDTPSKLLGDFLAVNVEPGLTVVNIYGQDGYGPGRQTNYGAVAEALSGFADEVNPRPGTVFVPYLMGCGLAGGDWDVYSELIEYSLSDATAVKLA